MAKPAKNDAEKPAGDDAPAFQPSATDEAAESTAGTDTAAAAASPAPDEPLAAADQQPPTVSPPAPEKVRYQVREPVFVNGSLTDPKGRKDVFVFAAPGLEGPALKLAPEEESGKTENRGGDEEGGTGPTAL